MTAGFTSVILPPKAGETIVQFVEPFLTHRKIRTPYARFTYGVDGRGGFAYLLIPVSDGVLYLQTEVA